MILNDEYSILSIEKSLNRLIIYLPNDLSNFNEFKTFVEEQTEIVVTNEGEEYFRTTGVYKFSEMNKTSRAYRVIFIYQDDIASRLRVVEEENRSLSAKIFALENELNANITDIEMAMCEMYENINSDNGDEEVIE